MHINSSHIQTRARRLLSAADKMAHFPYMYSDFLRPTRLIDQHFGLPLTPEDIILPQSSNAGSYYRPWHIRSQTTAIRDTGSTVANEKEKFQIFLDVQQFTPNELTVKTKANQIIIEGKHEEREDDHGFVSRQFTRKYTIPNDCDPNNVVSSLSSDGVLTVTAMKTLKTNKENYRIVPITKVGTESIKVTSIEKTSKSADGDLKKETPIKSNEKKVEDLRTGAKEEKCRLLAADGKLKISADANTSSIETELMGTQVQDSNKDKCDFGVRASEKKTKMAEASSIKSKEMICERKSSEITSIEAMSDSIVSELKRAAENL